MSPSAHHQFKRSVAPWIRGLARLGYGAKAIVYLSLGILATQAALNLGGETTGSDGTLIAIASKPFGQILLFLVSFGLLGYVLWRLVQAFLDPEHDGRDWSDIVRRLSYLASGIAYSSLALTALRLALGQPSQSNNQGSTPEVWATRLLQQPMGRWVVGAAGVCIIGVAFYYFYRAIKAKFRNRLRLHNLSQITRKNLIRICQFGIAARGLVFSIIGGYLIKAAITADADQARSTEGALEALQYSSSFGQWLLIVTAAGLVAYGIYMAVQARYRKIEAPS
ncbi:DUF1206 domain-containing protein [Leptolyngbya cf. ectocarpi LEGE 11479]|uniref:DUF1206 domain-containing protein n=1 Tax=Leptolyngbya cf. ectocarpi LEGE 11479 TaxID=1828722 RepID=A0A929FBN1_LEPEC|nr:DUF1206 domain-containing protein [Leptolyngbya ectocarpi]MBE9069159.1 DUF1206 domain-containing protein [Leptolyngbya cf. ectocarpi LEGE 11479]